MRRNILVELGGWVSSRGLTKAKYDRFCCGETKVRTPNIRRIFYKAYLGAKAHERPFMSRRANAGET